MPKTQDFLQQQQDDALWDVADVARYLKTTPTAVYNLTRSSSQARHSIPLPVIRLHKRGLRFRRQDILDWVNRLAERR